MRRMGRAIGCLGYGLLVFWMTGCTVVSPTSLERRGLVWQVRHQMRATLKDTNSEGPTMTIGDDALFRAVKAGDVDGLRKAHEQGKDLEVVNEDGQDLYELVIREGQEKIVDLLIEKQVSVTGGDAFHAAIELDQRQIFQRLLNERNDPNQHTRSGSTPLISAIKWGDIELVELLLEHGAKTDFADQHGSLPNEFVEKRQNMGAFPDVDYNYETIEGLLKE